MLLLLLAEQLNTSEVVNSAFDLLNSWCEQQPVRPRHCQVPGLETFFFFIYIYFFLFGVIVKVVAPDKR